MRWHARTKCYLLLLHPPSAIFVTSPLLLHVMPNQPQQDVVGVVVLQPVAQPPLHDAIQPSPLKVEWYVSQRRAHWLECPGLGGTGPGGAGVGLGAGVGAGVQPSSFKQLLHSLAWAM